MEGCISMLSIIEQDGLCVRRFTCGLLVGCELNLWLCVGSELLLSCLWLLRYGYSG